MSHETEKVKEDLKKLCVAMIEMLDKLKEESLLSEEEYKEHTHFKKKFLQDK
ncbi:hypothetical protein QBE52_16675 [Clostridiaceae bacterium 35-E11]